MLLVPEEGLQSTSQERGRGSTYVQIEIENNISSSDTKNNGARARRFSTFLVHLLLFDVAHAPSFVSELLILFSISERI
jgi:hypothetical protein